MSPWIDFSLSASIRLVSARGRRLISLAPSSSVGTPPMYLGTTCAPRRMAR